jgi:cytochrome c
MKYYYLNKIAMAVLVALLLFFGTRAIINIAYEEHEPAKPGYEVAGGEGKPGEEAKKPEEPGEEIIAALQTADPAKGEQDVALCKVCHSFEKGGANLVGPNLYGIVGTKIAEARGGFNFTPALKKHEGADWTFQNLDVWLTNPQAFAPGTTMAFPGIPDLKKRTDVIAYLNKNSDSPLPIPKPKPKEEAPAGGEKPEAGGKPAGPGGDVAAFLADVAAADPKKGESDAMLCKVCHTFDKGGATLIGPNLYGVVDREIASHEGFNYTPALKKHTDAKWTYENLDAWLTNPQAFAPGTTMAFPGIADTKKRAAVVAWLRTNAETPVPLPEAAPAAEEKPAAEEPKAEEEPAAPAAEEPAAEEKPAAEEPVTEEETMEETIVVPPTVSEDAPNEPSTGEPPSANQPQPVVPEASSDESGGAMMEEETMEETIVVQPTVSEDAPNEPSTSEPPSANQPQPVVPEASSDESGGAMMEEETMEETIVVQPTVSEDAPSEPSKGEPPSANQPQPVHPEGEPAMDDSTGSIAPSGGDALAAQPQPVYPNGEPEGL